MGTASNSTTLVDPEADLELDKTTSEDEKGDATRETPTEATEENSNSEHKADRWAAIMRKYNLSDRSPTSGGEQANTLRLQLNTEMANANRYRVLFEEYKETSRHYKEKASKLKLEIAEAKDQLKRAHERASAAELRATNSHQMAMEADDRAAEAEENAACAEAELEHAQCEAEDRIAEVEELLAEAKKAAAEAEAHSGDAKVAARAADKRRSEAEQALSTANEEAELRMAELTERLSESEAVAAAAKARLKAAESYIHGTKQLFDGIGLKHGELYKKYTEEDPELEPLAAGVTVSQAGLSTADRLIYLRGLHHEVEEFIGSVYHQLRETLDCSYSNDDEQYLFPDAYLENDSDTEDSDNEMTDTSNSDAESEIGSGSEDGTQGSDTDQSDHEDGDDIDEEEDEELEEDAKDFVGTEEQAEAGLPADADADNAEDQGPGNGGALAKKEPCEEYSEQEESWLKRMEELVGLRGLHLGDLLLIDRVYREIPSSEEMDYLEAHLRALDRQAKDLWDEVKHECADIIRAREERKARERRERKERKRQERRMRQASQAV